MLRLLGHVYVTLSAQVPAKSRKWKYLACTRPLAPIACTAAPKFLSGMAPPSGHFAPKELLQRGPMGVEGKYRRNVSVPESHIHRRFPAFVTRINICALTYQQGHHAINVDIDWKVA